MANVWHKLPAPPAGFAGSIGLSTFQAHLLYNRGVRRRLDVEPYLSADMSLHHDPTLLPDMDKAVARLTNALYSGETIGVFGDFDTDGITGTALLARAFRDLGGIVETYIPDRVSEGHGLNNAAIRTLAERKVSVLVTVDCGTNSTDEVEFAASLSIDIIVTDHHTPLPGSAYMSATINPKRPGSRYPYPELTGVGMAFKLAEALYSDLGKPYPASLLELVALGTVADVGPLTGENRYMVKKGLEILNTTKSPGIRALAANARIKIGSLDTQSLSFGLIPRLNAAGRLDHAGLSLDLLTATDPSRAQQLANDLERKNSERQVLTQRSVGEAKRQVDERLRSGEMPAIIIVASEDWIPGILGLIAANLSEHYHRPSIAISLGTEVSRASARSIPQFNIVDALRETQDVFLRFGGHPQAAGFAVPTSSLPLLEARLLSIAEKMLQHLDLSHRIEIDCEIPLALLNGDNLEFIQRLAPFGEGNPAPVFLTKNTQVVESRQVGRTGQHLKMRVSHGGSVWDAIAFRQGEGLKPGGSSADLVYTAGLNYWGDVPRPQLTVLDFN